MKNLIALAIGLVLLVSAAAAEGVGNSLTTEICSEAEGNCITGDITLAQIASSSSDITGCNNAANQYQDLFANDNCLTESGTDEGSIFAQMGTQEATVTSYDKVVNQDISLNAEENSFVNSDLTQAAKQATTSGVTQTTDVCASYNDATGSSIMQLSDVLTRGTTVVDQNVEYNCLVDSAIAQVADIDSSNRGFDNVIGQTSIQDAECNDLVRSALTQCNFLALTNVGNSNSLSQLAEASSEDNCLVDATALQSINETVESLGCDNIVKQDVNLENEDNSMTGGSLVQKSIVKSSA
jgi:hypothetical protein